MSETVQIKIEGMTCGHCTAAVEKALSCVPGVEKVVDVSLATGVATVEGSVAVDALTTAVKDAGYTVST
jgi:copper chaperone